MKRDEQHKKILSLRSRVKDMTAPEQENFAMLMKRDKDDEDLDAIALGELNRLHSKYVQKRTKEELEERWKNLGGV